MTVSAHHAAFLHVKPIAWGLTWQIFQCRLESSSTLMSLSCELLLSYRPTRTKLLHFLQSPTVCEQLRACWFLQWGEHVGAEAALGHLSPPQDPQQETCDYNTRGHFPPNACIKFVVVPHWTTMTAEPVSWSSTWTILHSTTWWVSGKVLSAV